MARKYAGLAVTCLGASVLLPLCASAQTLVTLRSLGLDAAREAAGAALEKCRKDGYHVSITVLDARGERLLQWRDDFAPPHTLENSDRKAYTALTFATPSGDWGKRVAADPASAGALQLARVTSLEGGLPVKAGGTVVGAIGVSGAPGGARDSACVQAGIDRIAKALE